MRILKHLSKAVLLLLILALALYGLYFYLVKSSVDRQIQEIRPFVDAQYDSLYVNPLGEIILNTVTVNLMGQPGIIIDSVSLKSDPLFFFQFESRVNQGNWPESLTLAVEGVNVDFNMPLFLLMEQFATNDSEGVQLSALGCGRVTQFDMTVLRMMGMRQGRFDFFLNLRSRDMGPLSLQFLSNMQGWGELLLDIDVGGNVGLNNLSAAIPNLQRVSFSLRDTGFNQRRNEFCSMQSGLSLVEYRQEHQSLVNDWIAQTLIPVSDDFITAYHKLAEPGAIFSIELNTKDINQDDLLSPQKLLDRLSQQLTLTINNQVQVLDADSADLLVALLQQPVVLPSEDVEPIIVEPSTPRGMPGVASPPVEAIPPIIPRRYQQTSPEELGNYVGHPVRFFTSFGKRVDGIMLSVEGTTVRVAERVQRGVAQYPVELDTIQGIEVYR